MNEQTISKLYNNMFDLNYLIRYGYYDIKPEKVSKPKNNDSDDFLLNEYYGNNETFYYNIFNTEHIADYLNIIDYQQYMNFKNIKSIRATEAVHFSIPKSSNTRRLLKMPNIYSYLALVYYTNDNKDVFINKFISNINSTSKFFNLKEFNYTTTHQMKDRLLFGGKNILDIDLANFYHTLYTHSIPWMIDGKQKSKSNTASGFANNIDKLLTKCQYNETHGIPTGNLVSKIIAELYMCYFDEKMQVEGHEYSRYVDDISYAYSLEEEKEKFQRDFFKICREHNLIVNERKMSINKFPYKSSNQKEQIFNYFNLHENLSINFWINKINSLIDFCVEEESLGNKGALKTIFPVIIKAINNNKIPKRTVNKIFNNRNEFSDFNIFEKLLDVSLKDSQLSNRFIGFVEKIHKMGFQKKNAAKIVRRYFTKNKDKYKKLIIFYSNHFHHQEQYQLLLYFVVFKVKDVATKNIILKFFYFGADDFSLILASILYFQKQCNLENWFEVADNLLQETHDSYEDNNHIRMTEKLWLFRYFIYSLQKKEVIGKKEINRYSNSKGYRQNPTRGYFTELNWDYVKNNPNQNDVDQFYEDLLDHEIQLIFFGKNNTFDYL